MDIKGKSVLVLGGWGLVGSAVTRRIVQEKPRNVIVASLKQWEAEEAVEKLRSEFPEFDKNFFIPWWGNIFVRDEFKDMSREEILSNPEYRRILIDDILGELTDETLKQSALYKLLNRFAPEIVIDCINTATAIAYQDIFTIALEVLHSIDRLKASNGKKEQDNLIELTERLLATLYVPQLIRHVQILYRSMQEVGTKIYVKIGTSGTGGMGLNIPYTHSEERPSKVLLSKSAVAGAHTLLLFLMGRTPDAPITKEIKPTAAIAWKKIGFGEIKRFGKPIELIDCPPDKAFKLNGKLELKIAEDNFEKLNETLKSVFIDTGENGLFSRAEFETLSTPGQMEYVTPEEIAETVIFEIKGGNTGHDIINALDHATLEPTYRAGFLTETALKRMRELEKQHGTESIAFELLGPPRLSKLLYEAHLLKLAFDSMENVIKQDPKVMSQKCAEIIKSNKKLRSQIISIGIPILMPDGETLIRGNEIKIPPYRGENTVEITRERINQWAYDGWVDLRVENMETWKRRFQQIIKETESIPEEDTSSRFVRTKEYWEDFKTINEGKLAGWILDREEHGMRMKS
ncbi:MAG: short-chain dehydrogenase [Candidatus Kryptonium sp.]|nr:short-chain dehydrogenase [Candidatus Kryptonium sp.]MCX7763155.1 short-chain dehydrogenase [Candidatus Kryptonium sp.]MDW8109124.1 short-chain dehydrogenase [Candidatus Kryptonium sp.]